MSRTPHPFRLAGLAFAATAFLAACGSGSDTTAADSAEAIVTTSTATDPSAVDPCGLYPAADMAEQMGADDVESEAVDGVAPTCTYGSDAHHLKAELAVLDEDQLANTPRDPTAYLTDEAKGSLEVLDVSGIGDEVFGSTAKGGVTLVVRTGTTGYSLLLTNAGGGPDAANWTDEGAMVSSAKAILEQVVGS